MSTGSNVYLFKTQIESRNFIECIYRECCIIYFGCNSYIESIYTEIYLHHIYTNLLLVCANQKYEQFSSFIQYHLLATFSDDRRIWSGYWNMEHARGCLVGTWRTGKSCVRFSDDVSKYQWSIQGETDGSRKASNLLNRGCMII